MGARPEPGLCYGTLRETRFAELVRVAGENGFRGIMIPLFPAADAAELPQVRELLRQNGIRRVVLDGVMGPLPRCRFAAEHGLTADGHFAVARQFGVDCFNVPHYQGDPATPLVEFVDALGPFCERALREGITIALEFLPGTGIPDMERALRIVEALDLPNTGITLDTWHWARCRGTLADIRALRPGVIKDFQLSDRSALQDSLPDSEQWGRLLPGEGALPLAEIVRAVCANAPDITVNAEIFSHELQQQAPAQAARAVAHAMAGIL